MSGKGRAKGKAPPSATPRPTTPPPQAHQQPGGNAAAAAAVEPAAATPSILDQACGGTQQSHAPPPPAQPTPAAKATDGAPFDPKAASQQGQCVAPDAKTANQGAKPKRPAPKGPQVLIAGKKTDLGGAIDLQADYIQASAKSLMSYFTMRLTTPPLIRLIAEIGTKESDLAKAMAKYTEAAKLLVKARDALHKGNTSAATSALLAAHKAYTEGAKGVNAFRRAAIGHAETARDVLRHVRDASIFTVTVLAGASAAAAAGKLAIEAAGYAVAEAGAASAAPGAVLASAAAQSVVAGALAKGAVAMAGEGLKQIDHKLIEPDHKVDWAKIGNAGVDTVAADLLSGGLAKGLLAESFKKVALNATEHEMELATEALANAASSLLHKALKAAIEAHKGEEECTYRKLFEEWASELHKELLAGIMAGLYKP